MREKMSMQLIVDPTDYPNVIQTRASLKRDGLKGEFIHVFDGTWNLMPLAYWYSRSPKPRPNNNLSSFQRPEKYPGWFFYSTLSIRQPERPAYSAFRNFGSDKSIDYVRGYVVSVILNGLIQPTWESPSSIHWENREKIADLVSEMQLSHPDYPEWAGAFPIAILGDGIRFWRGEAASVFCPISDDFAVEITITASLNYRPPTIKELRLIKESLT
jgi:hypothetical protein